MDATVERGTMRNRVRQKGQIMTEYMVALGMFVGVAMTLALLLAVFSEYGWRIISLVGLEY